MKWHVVILSVKHGLNLIGHRTSFAPLLCCCKKTPSGLFSQQMTYFFPRILFTSDGGPAGSHVWRVLLWPWWCQDHHGNGHLCGHQHWEQTAHVCSRYSNRTSEVILSRAAQKGSSHALPPQVCILWWGGRSAQRWCIWRRAMQQTQALPSDGHRSWVCSLIHSFVLITFHWKGLIAMWKQQEITGKMFRSDTIS